MRPEGAAFARVLAAEGALGPGAEATAGVPVADLARDAAGVLFVHGLIGETCLARARARYHGLPFIDPARDPPDIRLIDRLGAAECLRDGLLPWREVAGQTLVLVASPESVPRHQGALEARFGATSFAFCPRSTLEAALVARRASVLRGLAEARPAPQDSCRTLRLSPRVLTLAVAAFATVALTIPGGVLGGLTLLALLAMLCTTTIKAAALMAALRRPADPAPTRAAIARLPTVSIIVALLHEADIAPRLVRRLGRLDYPRDLLDILIAVEEGDTLTRRALAASDLPPWMRIIAVPHGALRTKPRALNYALGFARGSLIGVYDAEDAPEPDQIRRVVDRFHQRDGRVACLQGVLDFYNPATNWLARCFTLEYAAWFRVVLPGLDRLGLPIPLGGTTLFFRRAALEQIGAWDAHNVTEDADLGIRLCRHGYRTEVIDSVTREEANCHPLPWVRQRSRWIKGYMNTRRTFLNQLLDIVYVRWAARLLRTACGSSGRLRCLGRNAPRPKPQRLPVRNLRAVLRAPDRHRLPRSGNCRR